ncbi:hypothetical protein Efla_006225 [Eimeria flavescens]
MQLVEFIWFSLSTQQAKAAEKKQPSTLSSEYHILMHRRLAAPRTPPSLGFEDLCAFILHAFRVYIHPKRSHKNGPERRASLMFPFHLMNTTGNRPHASGAEPQSQQSASATRSQALPEAVEQQHTETTEGQLLHSNQQTAELQSQQSRLSMQQEEKRIRLVRLEQQHEASEQQQQERLHQLQQQKDSLKLQLQQQQDKLEQQLQQQQAEQQVLQQQQERLERQQQQQERLERQQQQQDKLQQKVQQRQAEQQVLLQQQAEEVRQLRCPAASQTARGLNVEKQRVQQQLQQQQEEAASAEMEDGEAAAAASERPAASGSLLQQMRSPWDDFLSSEGEEAKEATDEEGTVCVNFKEAKSP